MIELTARQLQLLCIAGMLPFLGYLTLRVRPSTLLSLGLAAEVFSGFWRTMGISVPLDRMLLFGGFFALFMDPDSRAAVRRNMNWIAWLLVALTIYTMVSFVTHNGLVGGRGFWGIFDRLGVLPFVAFFAAPVAFARQEDRDFFFRVIIVLGAYLSMTAVFEVIGPHSLVFPQYITNPNITTHLGRARGPFIEAVANGMAMFCCGVLSLVAARVWRVGVWRQVAFFVAGLSVLGAFLSLTRSVWLGSVVAAICGCLVVPGIRKYLVPGLAVVGVAVFCMLAFVPGLHKQATDRLDQRAPIYDRINTANAAWAMIEAKPLFGFGWNTFERHSADYMKQTDVPLTAKNVGVHNIALGFGADLGLIGLSLWSIAVIAAIGGAIRVNWQPANRHLAGAVIAISISWAGVAMLTPLAQAFPNLLLWMWAGIAMCSASSSSPEEIDLREVVRV